MTCHILFVDDEPENLVVFEACCAEKFPILTASSGDQALELMRTNEVAVLLADQRMPGMTGLELLERAQAEFPQTIRMLVTAYSDLGTAIDAINRGRVRRYLRKPWDQDELRATIAEALDLYQTTAKMRMLERRLFETERVYALGVIASGLSRELGQPVGALRASIARAREVVRDVAAALPKAERTPLLMQRQLLEADEALGEAHTGAGRLLDVARCIALPSDSSGELTDLSEVLRLTLKLLQAEIRASTSLELDVRSVPHVPGSTAQLGHVVLNLLINALEAMTTEPKERRRLAIRLLPEERWVRFEVAHSGPGTDSDQLALAFDPFHPAKDDRGTWLGLAISKTIVEQVGGTIQAESPPSGGALFRVRLPTTR